MGKKKQAKKRQNENKTSVCGFIDSPVCKPKNNNNKCTVKNIHLHYIVWRSVRCSVTVHLDIQIESHIYISYVQMQTMSENHHSMPQRKCIDKFLFFWMISAFFLCVQILVFVVAALMKKWIYQNVWCFCNRLISTICRPRFWISKWKKNRLVENIFFSFHKVR